MRGDRTSVRLARMLGNSARRKRSPLTQYSSASRFTAGASGFLLLIPVQ